MVSEIVPKHKSVASHQQVGEDVTRQVFSAMVGFRWIAAIPDGMEFSVFIYQKREGKDRPPNPRKRFSQ